MNASTIGLDSVSPSGQYAVVPEFIPEKDGSHHFKLLKDGAPLIQASVNFEITSTCVDDCGNFCLALEKRRKRTTSKLLFYKQNGTLYGCLSFKDCVPFFKIEAQGQSVLIHQFCSETVELWEIALEKRLSAITLPRYFSFRSARLDADSNEVLIEDASCQFFRFSLLGQFLDQAIWLNKFLETCDGVTLYHVISDIHSASEDWTREEFASAAAWLEIGITRGIEDTFTLKRSEVFSLLTSLYKSAGDAANSEDAGRRCLEATDGFSLVDLVESNLNTTLESRDHKIILNDLRRLDVALSYPRLASYPNYLSRLYRARGELQNAMGNTKLAIESLQNALQVNPKIGCKRLLESLKGGNRSVDQQMI